jgi:competence protein ComEC
MLRCLLLLPFLLLPNVFRWFVVNRSSILSKIVSSIDFRLLCFLLKPINRLRAIRLGISWPWLVMMLLMGAARYNGALPAAEEHTLTMYNDSEILVSLEGVVIAYPDQRDQFTGLTLQVDRLQPEGEVVESVEGRVLARLELGGQWHYGDRLLLEGYLITPGEDDSFSYKEYLARQGIYSLLVDARALRLSEGHANPILLVLYHLRDHAQSTLYQFLPDPEASLLAGILLGLERGIPEDLVQAFQTTGTAHIVAISGFNMTLLAGLCTALFVRGLGQQRGAWMALIVIAMYTLLVGAQASVIRAAIMSGLGVFAALVGRRQNGLNSLAFIGAVMAAIHPYVLWDVGFQLSVSATLGLVLFGESWPQGFERLVEPYLEQGIARRLSGPVGEYFLLTLAAQIMTLPVIAYHFGRFSLVSLVANPLILPAQPAIMILGGISTLVGMVYLPAGKLVAFMVWPLIAFTIRVVEACAGLPGAEVILGQVGPAFVMGFYGAVLGWAFLQRRIQAGLRRVGPTIGLALLVILTVQVWRAALATPDDKLHITLLDVSRGNISGEAILIQTPQGRFVLINGGPSPNQLSEALGRRLAGSAGELDALIIAGVEEGQIQALPGVVNRFTPAEVVWAGETHANRPARYLYEALITENRLPQRARSGMSLDLGQGARLEFLAVRPRGAVLWLEWERFRMLLPLGIDFDAMENLQTRPDLRSITTLVLAGSGYIPLNPPDWLKSLEPEVILLSVSALDARGLPDDEVIIALQDYPILRTDVNGWIELTTDGEQLWLEVERK